MADDGAPGGDRGPGLDTTLTDADIESNWDHVRVVPSSRIDMIMCADAVLRSAKPSMTWVSMRTFSVVSSPMVSRSPLLSSACFQC